tara:strand:- start:86 stop:379 length:294 start_codon:yes stop_codon:yes gene_type:complete
MNRRELIINLLTLPAALAGGLAVGAAVKAARRSSDKLQEVFSEVSIGSCCYQVTGRSPDGKWVTKMVPITGTEPVDTGLTEIRRIVQVPKSWTHGNS